MDDAGFLNYQIEVKEIDQVGTFEGYASVFRNIDLQRDIVDPGAFARTLKHSRGVVPILMAHDPGRMVAVGTSAEEDSKGLRVTGEFTLENREGQDAYATVKAAAKHGLKLGLSIGYWIPDGGALWDEKRGVRHLKDIDLLEYSIAPTPANPRATITGVKSADDLARLYGKRAIESLLVEKGFSRRDAMVSAVEIYDAVQRDANRKTTHTEAARDASATVQRDAVSLPQLRATVSESVLRVVASAR